ncbi:CoA transferase [Falsiruegeria mediterranea]|uniref:Formyl-CoA:oxalate CoA-transferase n=1 Tax=Falsiruegeria mediterranea M17 TaxID=1200281 RepID=A0A2R8C3D7_9RHOB|nr:CoA transferase [Falsiruegeria mediterranea]SPJ26945.1 Formyl-CoA:oxalate CoA-transferase [Falsiruegeria mediterranea M17]
MDAINNTFGTSPAHVVGEGAWKSCFAVTELACQSMGAVGGAVADLVEALNLGPKSDVAVDRRLASLWFTWSIHPQGWEVPPSWDAIAGDYQTRDGWIKLHTNAPHHRAAALSVLECKADRDVVAQAVSGWDANALEAAIVEVGGAAAAMRSRAAWQVHPQGVAVAAEPLVHWDQCSGLVRGWQAKADRPLAGLRVLDLTRVLAGPVATRTLAGFGADVLRVDPASWGEPGVVPDVTLGKRCCHLDLKTGSDKEVLHKLLTQADVLVHGYRPGALDAMIGSDRPDNLIEVCLDAYGWTGPWAGRRGFDSLVQMSCGVAEAGMVWAGSNKPHPLPVQALDHATGYFMAAAVVSALTRAVRGDGIHRARLSLARTAEVLAKLEPVSEPEITGSTPADLDDWIENSPWGPAKRLKPGIEVVGAPMRWDRPSAELGSSPASWG